MVILKEGSAVIKLNPRAEHRLGGHGIELFEGFIGRNAFIGEDGSTCNRCHQAWDGDEKDQEGVWSTEMHSVIQYSHCALCRYVLS